MIHSTSKAHDRIGLRAALPTTIAIAAALAGCTGPTADTPAETTPAPTSTPAAASPTGDEATRLQQHLDTLEQQFTAPEGAMAASAVPSGHLDTGRWQTTVLQDQDEVIRPAGAHQLSVHCTGTGSLGIELRIGTDHASAQLPQCEPGTSTQIVDLTTSAPSAPTTVTITPAPGTVAAMAYVLT